MVMLCPKCGKGHLPEILLCEQAEKMHQAFLRRVEHHKEHCDCPNPESHQRSIDNSKERTPPKF